MAVRARKSAVDDHIVALRNDELMFVTQGVGCVADQIEQSIAARFNVSAVLDVVGRLIPFSRLIVPLVKQCIEGLQNKRLVSCFL
jgi:hypothetical protein